MDPLAALRARPDTWLDLGHVPTTSSVRGFLRAAPEGAWEIYEEQKDGTITLGFPPDHIHLFDEPVAGAPEVIPEPTLTRLRAFDAELEAAWPDLLTGRMSFRDDAAELVFHAGSWWMRNDSIGPVERGWVIHRVRDAMWRRRATFAPPSADLREALALFYDRARLAELLLRGEVRVSAAESSLRGENGRVVETYLTGDDEPSPYAGYVDPYDQPVYADRDCPPERMRALLAGEIRAIYMNMPKLRPHEK